MRDAIVEWAVRGLKFDEEEAEMMSMRNLLMTAFCVLFAGAVGAALGQCTLTGNFDMDFVGKPGVVIKNSGDVGYPISAPPLPEFHANGLHRFITEGAVVPSGFRISRVALAHLCGPDVLCAGLDVSNEITFQGMSTGIHSVAWDADGDGNPCAVTNPFLAEIGDLDWQIPGNDDLPGGGLSEMYMLFLDLDRDGTTDVWLTAYDNGTVAGSDPVAIDFAGPCPDSVIHVTLKRPNGQNLLAPPYNMTVDLVYGQDIEFRITGLRALTGPTPLFPDGACDLNVSARGDSGLDGSIHCAVDLGAFEFPDDTAVDITCEKQVRLKGTTEWASQISLCRLPATVEYRLCATNISPTPDTPVTIRITDPVLGVDQTFPGVANGQTVCAPIVERVFGPDFCGQDEFVNTMTATADAEGCCLRGTLTATCQSQSRVIPPPTRSVQVQCLKQVRLQGTTEWQTEIDLCRLPATVEYRLCAFNLSSPPDSTATIRIQDPQFGVDQTFTNVAVGQMVCAADDDATPEVFERTFGLEYWGAPAFQNALSVQAALSAGVCGCAATYPWSECLACVRFPYPNPKTQLDGVNVKVNGVVTAAFAEHFYLEPADRLFGIRAEQPEHRFEIGAKVSLGGEMRTNTDGERYVRATSSQANGSGYVWPMALTCRCIGGADWGRVPGSSAGQVGVEGGSGLNNIGLLIRTWGRFQYVDEHTFVVSDGSGTGVRCVVPDGVALNQGWSYVGVTGVCSCKKEDGKIHPLILVRRKDDIIPY